LDEWIIDNWNPLENKKQSPYLEKAGPILGANGSVVENEK